MCAAQSSGEYSCYVTTIYATHAVYPDTAALRTSSASGRSATRNGYAPAQDCWMLAFFTDVYREAVETQNVRHAEAATPSVRGVSGTTNRGPARANVRRWNPKTSTSTALLISTLHSPSSTQNLSRLLPWITIRELFTIGSRLSRAGHRIWRRGYLLVVSGRFLSYCDGEYQYRCRNLVRAAETNAR